MPKQSLAVRVAILGDGGWGTTLAIYFHRLGHHVRWWGAFPEYVRILDRRRSNERFLPGVAIPRSLPITADLPYALDKARIVVLAIPSQYLRSVVSRLRGMCTAQTIFLNVAKGLERSSRKRLSSVVHEELGSVHFAVLSGPNIAAEIARNHPASSVVASHRPSIARMLQSLFMSEQLRLYTSNDVIGVELGGALKNPIAIAAGIGDGLGFGSNTKAALISRGLVEMARLGVALGAKKGTFWGLSGLGDLVTTCMSGRNRWLGEELGKGRKLTSVLASTRMIIEGVETAYAALSLARQRKVELPITEQVQAILSGRQSPRRALQALMRRAGKPEANYF